MPANLRIGITVGAVLLGLLGWVVFGGGSGNEDAVKKEAVESVLFTGKEEKAPVKLAFVDQAKAGFANQTAEIFLSDSRTARIKQVLQKFFEGPVDQGEGGSLRATFPAGAAAREVFLDDSGLCVVDLARSAVDGHPGGTTAEYQSLYTLFKTLRQNFPEIQRVQIMVEGRRVSSLAGHLDIMDPITPDYF
jgi:hypothetical protein